MKRFLSLLLIFTLIIACAPVIPFQANAATSGYYTYTVSNGEAEITDCDQFIRGDIVIPSTLDGYPVTSIGSGAFGYCYDLESVVIGGSVTSIGAGAFELCDDLESVVIGGSVTSIGAGAFELCDSLKSVVIGDSVTNLGDSVFGSCYNLQSVTLGSGITVIPDSAFEYCESLKSIDIPDSVTSIGKYAFSGCYSLTDVYYAGTQSQWNDISIDYYNYSLTNATIHYNHIHDYSLFQPVEVAATCAEEGYTKYTCAYGDIFRENITPALGHDYSGAVTVVAPTCTEQGYTETQCIRCAETKKTNYTNALGHNCPSVETVKEPTCTEAGSAVGQCTVCKETITSVISSLGHKMVAVPAVNATCTSDGLTLGTKCERCDFVGIAQTTVPATGHSFADGACTACGLEGVALHKQDDTETYYNTFEEALAVTDGTIQLLADVTADTVNLNANVTLDLNGYTLTADSISGKVMDSQDGEGLVKVSAQSAVISSNDDQLILWDNAADNAGYRVFHYTLTNMGLDAHGDDESESAKYGATVKSVWSDLVFTNPYAYTLAASTYSGLKIGFQLSWTPDGGTTASKTFHFAAATVGAWGTAEEGNTGAENYCFYIRVTGFEELYSSGTVAVKPVISTAFNSAETAVTELRYEYVALNPGGLTYETGFDVVPEI